MLHQVCLGMVSLANAKIVHRDLAARNVLVFAYDAANAGKTLVKVSDFGLSKGEYSRFDTTSGE